MSHLHLWFLPHWTPADCASAASRPRRWPTPCCTSPCPSTGCLHIQPQGLTCSWSGVRLAVLWVASMTCCGCLACWHHDMRQWMILHCHGCAMLRAGWRWCHGAAVMMWSACSTCSTAARTLQQLSSKVANGLPRCHAAMLYGRSGNNSNCMQFALAAASPMQ